MMHMDEWESEFVDFAAGVAAIERGMEEPCQHNSMDGTGHGDVWVCMECGRLLRHEKLAEHVHKTVLLKPDEVLEIVRKA